MDALIDNVQLPQNQSLDLNDFDIFDADRGDENNNIALNEGLEEGFKFELPKIFEEDVKFGVETLSNIAEMVNTIVRRKANLEEVVKDSKIPSNCKNITPPKVNVEIWSFLRRNVKSLDLSMQTVQKLLGMGIVPVVRLAELLSKKEFEIKDLRALTLKALTILCSVFFEFSYSRKMILKPHLEPKYHLLCNRNEEIGENLFGDDVSKRIKEINEAQKLQNFMCRKGMSSKNFTGSRGSGTRGAYMYRRGQSQQSLYADRSNNRGMAMRGRGSYSRRPSRRF